MTFLNTSETLARIGGVLPPGHRLFSLALELAAMAGSRGEAETTRKLFPPDKTAHGWDGEVGALGDPEGSPGIRAASYLLWLGPPVEATTSAEGAGHRADASALSEPSPGLRQLVLNPPPGRYRIEYWDASDCRLAGVEIGTASPLVLGPPESDAPLIALIISLF
ncbi:MAG TPA: hypothetical protein VN445_12025 [Rectinemataceae bacterium]|nr:hypothetical protein [Rectinemataceae bacterium]